jgi:cytochrome c oxidase subunit 2
MWWWRVAYLDADGREVLQDANEIHIPTGRPVALELESTDVIHSLWIPRLGGKLDMIPGRRNILRLQADGPGEYGGQCAEFCGGPHALMALVVVAHDPAEFRGLARPPSPSRPPSAHPSRPAPRCSQGRLRGLPYGARNGEANGLAGPDLTHVGARRTLGAGILPNNQGTLAGWVSDSQAIKPGNRMPAYPVLSGQELRDVAAYLDSLK